jgi:hypothetical protein
MTTPQRVKREPIKDKTVIKMVYLSVLFFGGIVAGALLPEGSLGIVSSAVMLGILLVLFKL